MLTRLDRCHSWSLSIFGKIAERAGRTAIATPLRLNPFAANGEFCRRIDDAAHTFVTYVSRTGRNDLQPRQPYPREFNWSALSFSSSGITAVPLVILNVYGLVGSTTGDRLRRDVQESGVQTSQRLMECTRLIWLEQE